MVLAHLHCPSGASLHYAVCHTPCCSYSLRSGSYLCPSCHFIHFVLRYATLHLVRSLTICYKSWHTLPYTNQSTSDAHSFSQTNATILTGFHSATLRPTFISVAFSPPAAYNFARLACLLQLRVCHGFWPATQWLDETKTHAKPLRIT